jgi:subtilase family serine protease
MRNMSKVVGLLGTLLLVAGGIGLAADLPDLVPWGGGGGGGIGVKEFSCVGTDQSKTLKIMLGIKNIGSAKTTYAVKTLVKVDGVVWSNPNNPHTTAADMWPNQHQDFSMNGPAPGPGTHTLWVKVDSDNAEAELNENNNEVTATTTCAQQVQRVPQVQPPQLYPKPKIGPPPVEQKNVAPAQTK